MTTLNAMASNAYNALIAETLRDNPGDVWAGFENERDAFETAWEAGHKAATAEASPDSAALGYAWSVLRDIANGDLPYDETPAQFAARNMEDLRKYHPAATEGLES